VLNPKWRQWMSQCKEINFVLGWLQENGFGRLKRVPEGKKNFPNTLLLLYCYSKYEML
jgi:hypothetical protein